MIRNLIVLASAGLLALGLSISSFAGVEPDTDGDGFVDSEDNCLTEPNGPAGGACTANEDGLNSQNVDEPDGYGNACDTDFQNNGATDAANLGSMFTAFTVVSTAVHFDINCNGAADAADLGRTFTDFTIVDPVGPSGLACAGTVSCP